MGRKSERRALYYEDDPDYDPFVGVDVNEYLIENYEGLTLKQRKAIWTLCQNDEDFNYDPIYEEIDAWVAHVTGENVTDECDSEAENSEDVSDERPA